MHDITSRKDLAELVHLFYARIRQDDVLGPIFNRHVNDWTHHEEVICDFWESQLLFTKRYRGNPLEAHVQLDKKEGYTLSNEDFGLWMNLWYKTVDELFEGEVAERAKNNARKMSTYLYLKMFEKRGKM
jgi:hemoglobin